MNTNTNQIIFYNMKLNTTNSSYKANITLIPKPDKDPTSKNRQISLKYIETKNYQQTI